MDDRGHLAQALIDRLGAQGLPHKVLAVAGIMEIALERAALARVPGMLAEFCREFDLRLVQMASREHDAWEAVLAWSDEFGRPRFLSLRLFGDWCRGMRRLLRSDELLDAAPDVRFAHALLRFMEKDAEGAGENLSSLWREEPRGAMEQIARFWRRPSDMRLLAQAAKHGDWSAVNGARLRLGKAMERATYPHPAAALGRALRVARLALEPSGAAIAFICADVSRGEAVREAAVRDLAPAFPHGMTSIVHAPGEDHGVDLRIVFDDPRYAAGWKDAVAVSATQPLPGLVAEAELAILRWLESRVERRYPEALVGRNPSAARLLQWVTRHEIPLGKALAQTLLNCDLQSQLPAPILMPHPYGIVIEPGAEIGNRVTIMQQATIGRGGPGQGTGAPIIEDNVYIGPGARILGALRIGRGAIVGANAVVTRDVPSHCTVIGVNHVLGRRERRAVADARRTEDHAVVNS